MDLTLESKALQEILTSANQIVILISPTGDKDTVAAGLALYLSIKSLSKNETIAYPKQPTVGWGNLVGVNKITQKLGNKNFVISLDYLEGSIEKVSYNIEGNKFNLVVEPRRDAPLFDEKKVKYSYSGFNADAIFVLGAKTLEDLGSFYEDNKPQFEQKPIIAINNLLGSEIGKINFVRPGPSISEIVTHLITQAQMPMDTDIATNLWTGLIFASKNFIHPQTNADSFEAAAIILKMGARRENKQQFEETPQGEVALSRSTEKVSAPPDWLKPKIYKGSTLL